MLGRPRMLFLFAFCRNIADAINRESSLLQYIVCNVICSMDVGTKAEKH